MLLGVYSDACFKGVWHHAQLRNNILCVQKKSLYHGPCQELSESWAHRTSLISEFKASLVYLVSSRPARATQSDLVTPHPLHFPLPPKCPWSYKGHHIVHCPVAPTEG